MAWFIPPAAPSLSVHCVSAALQQLPSAEGPLPRAVNWHYIALLWSSNSYVLNFVASRAVIWCAIIFARQNGMNLHIWGCCLGPGMWECCGKLEVVSSLGDLVWRFSMGWEMGVSRVRRLLQGLGKHWKWKRGRSCLWCYFLWHA